MNASKVGGEVCRISVITANYTEWRCAQRHPDPWLPLTATMLHKDFWHEGARRRSESSRRRALALLATALIPAARTVAAARTIRAKSVREVVVASGPGSGDDFGGRACWPSRFSGATGAAVRCGEPPWRRRGDRIDAAGRVGVVAFERPRLAAPCRRPRACGAGDVAAARSRGMPDVGAGHADFREDARRDECLPRLTAPSIQSARRQSDTEHCRTHRRCGSS